MKNSEDRTGNESADQMEKAKAEQTKACPEIVYEDNHVLVAVKAPGVLSQADGSQAPDMLTLLKHYLKVKYDKPGKVYLGLVHRLDRPVGGLMVFAKTSKAASRLSEQIRRHEMEKIYLAIVDGCPEPEQGQWHDTLRKDRQQNKVTRSDPDQGQAAWLSYKTLQTHPASGLSLIAVKLGTGRGHQIRVQLALHGCPIAGDRKYHPAYMNQSASRNPHIKTAALWAGMLGFRHPVTRDWLWFSAPVPEAIPWTLFEAVENDVFSDWKT